MRANALTCLLTLVVGCELPAAANVDDGARIPPPGVTIYNELSELWHTRQFREVERVVTALKSEYPGYIPAEVAYMIYRYKRGEQVEEMLSGLKWLDEAGDKYPYMLSPLYRSVVRSSLIIRKSF